MVLKIEQLTKIVSSCLIMPTSSLSEQYRVSQPTVLNGRSARQAKLEVGVAELVDRTGLTEHAPLLMGISEEAHQPPWDTVS